MDKKVKHFLGIKRGMVGRRAKSDLDLHRVRAVDQFKPMSGQPSRSCSPSINSADDEDSSVDPGCPAIFVSSISRPDLPSLYYQSNNVRGETAASSNQGQDEPGRSESPLLQLSVTTTPSPGSRKSSKGNDSQNSPRTPTQQEIVPKMNKSRNEKFHKLFKTIPEDEFCLKGYSCAYMGDILLQGYLYISPNWFCFHSKILGIEKQIKLRVEDVLNITREKTAIFIPNAIGVVTAEDKYVFGSLLSRDNTYRIMFAVWKSLTDPGGTATKMQMQITDDDVLDTTKDGGTSIDDSESENSLCMQCGTPMSDHPQNSCKQDSASDTGNAYGEGSNAETISSQAGPTLITSTTVAPSGGSPSTSSCNPSVATPDAVSHAGKVSSLAACPGHKKATVMTHTLQSVKKVPRTHLLLLVCVLMVTFLSISAVIMLHKILVLQTMLGTGAPAPGFSDSEDVYSSMYYLNHETHVSNIKRFHTVLEANINVLDQIHSSLKNLQLSLSQLKSNTCVTTEDSGQEQFYNPEDIMTDSRDL